MYGVCGALAVEAYRVTREHDVSMVHSHPYVIVMSIVWIIIGGVFASAWEDDHPLKCLYIGSTFPIWLSAWTHMVAAQLTQG
jgi:hypothetical protein